MHDSISELEEFHWHRRRGRFVMWLGIVIFFTGTIWFLIITQAELVGLGIVFSLAGLIVSLLGIVSIPHEEDFAMRYDMTHILDLDGEEERLVAYRKHLTEWVASGIETVNPIRTRGNDPAGPDWGKTDFMMGQEPVRRDAIVEGEKYAGLEGDLSDGEKMVESANVQYADMAQKRWEEAEANDPDLIEYGVEKLGDLVRTDYFDKNAEEGAFSKAASPEEEDSQ
jgi:hypothetical protein